MVTISFGAGETLWDRTVDLSVQTRAESEELPAHAFAESREEPAQETVHIAQSYVRELSLPSSEGDETGKIEQPPPKAEPGSASFVSKLEQLFRALMTGASGWLRRLAHWLQPS
jgi:hypothetical protein